MQYYLTARKRNATVCNFGIFNERYKNSINCSRIPNHDTRKVQIKYINKLKRIINKKKQKKKPKKIYEKIKGNKKN